MFVKSSEDGKARIMALKAAVIVRTYLDLYNEKVLVNIKKKNGWDHDVAFKNALVPLNRENRLKLATDLTYRLFIVAYQSELLNTVMGNGYWPVLFRPIYLRRYIYV